MNSMLEERVGALLVNGAKDPEEMIREDGRCPESDVPRLVPARLGRDLTLQSGPVWAIISHFLYRLWAYQDLQCLNSAHTSAGGGRKVWGISSNFHKFCAITHIVIQVNVLKHVNTSIRRSTGSYLFSSENVP